MTASGASAGPSTCIRSSSGAVDGQLARKAFRGRTVAGGNDQAGEPAERRIAGALARLDLAGVKRLAVAGDQRLHHGMVGLMGLQVSNAAALLAAGAPDHLVEQLKRPLGGARIAIAEAEIGIDDADQIEPREIMPLRHELRADDDIDAAFRDLVQFAAHGLDRGDEVARQHHGARAGKRCSRLFLQALHARADRDQRFLRRAVRADMRPRHRETAMVADQPLAKAVIDQPGVADGAGKTMPAGAAQCQRRITAAIEEQQRLLAPLDRVLDLLGQPRRNETAARRRLPPQIDRLDLRHVLAAEPRGQRDALVAAPARIDLGLDRGRCGGQHDRNFGDVSAHHRHVAGMIMRALFLLVGLVVLLVDDDQTEIGVGQKQRRARPDDDRRFARRNRRPIAGAGPRGQFGMPFQRAHAKTLRKTVEELAGQRDLRHQDQ